MTPPPPAPSSSARLYFQTYLHSRVAYVCPGSFHRGHGWAIPVDEVQSYVSTERSSCYTWTLSAPTTSSTTTTTNTNSITTPARATITNLEHGRGVPPAAELLRDGDRMYTQRRPIGVVQVHRLVGQLLPVAQRAAHEAHELPCFAVATALQKRHERTARGERQERPRVRRAGGGEGGRGAQSVGSPFLKTRKDRRV